MRNEGPPKFLSHEGWDPKFPGIGYPEYAKCTLVEGTLDSGAPLEGRRSVTTLGPRVQHIPILLESGKSQKSQADNATFRTPSSSSQAAKTQTFSSLPLSGHVAKSSKPSMGAFKAQVRVNNPVSWEEKRSAADAQHRQKGKPKPDPQAQINGIVSKWEELKVKVEQFSGSTSADKDYRYLDEMLTRLMLKLDDVETDDHPHIRQQRKKAIKDVQSCVSLLEERLAQNQANQRDSAHPHSV